MGAIFHGILVLGCSRDFALKREVQAQLKKLRELYSFNHENCPTAAQPPKGSTQEDPTTQR